eukprot:TRINITY_DN1774_c0_g1_i1.p1 TRINITY_DN1774_c0_g1~~TRINITY_DN1774_c0_g1_i1.p1  ORF type:complete len:132 (+),score=39.90 TRINITY_DN1774_c0_g1_i1:31-396(+)
MDEALLHSAVGEMSGVDVSRLDDDEVDQLLAAAYAMNKQLKDGGRRRGAPTRAQSSQPRQDRLPEIRRPVPSSAPKAVGHRKKLQNDAIAKENERMQRKLLAVKSQVRAERLPSLPPPRRR